MKTISRDKISYRLDRSNPPAMEINSGEIVRFETYDARTGTVKSEADLLDRPHPAGTNPATGPVAVKGAGLRDSLAVEIIHIELASEGFLAVKKGVGLLGSRAEKCATRMIPIQDGMVQFSDQVQFPVRPMIGVIGTAPPAAGVETGLPGPHGGNMDNRYVREGATVHLPIAVPGALLSIGDIHASMGDGEITMVGLEICGAATAKIDVIENKPLARPWIETPEWWITTGDSLDPVEALRIAAEEMVELLRNRLAVDFEEAYMLMSACADVQVCQICAPGSFPTTARAVFPGPRLPAGATRSQSTHMHR